MLTLAAQIVTALVAALHLWFLALEMFLWRKPIGLKTFRNSPEKAEMTAVLAANQGLYNGFLAAGLVASLLLADAGQAHAFRVFFLSCVIVAGAYGAWSVSRRILYIQALPAAIALGLSCLAG
jgi:putative membrane protein